MGAPPGSSNHAAGLDLTIVPAPLPHPDTFGNGEAVAIGTGRGDDKPQYGDLWWYEKTLHKDYPDARFPSGRHVFRFGESRYFAIAARDPHKEKGSDDLHGVYVAAEELLNEVNQHYDCLHLALPATPRGSLSAVYAFPPVYAFIEAIRSFGAWKRENPSSRLRMTVYTVQPDVWLNLTSGRINIEELLTSDLMHFWAVIQTDEKREPARPCSLLPA
jgi:hypothetical protein